MLDWRTEEDSHAWQEPPPPAPPPRQRFFLLLPILALLLLAGGAYYGYSQVRQRMSANVRAAQTDVLTSHELLIHATTTSDKELFSNLLSGRNAGWTNAQIELFLSYLLFNRPQMGLATAEIRAGDPTIILSPDLEEATVRRPVRYTVLATGETITLENISFYRRGAERWLLAPLDTAEWRTEAQFSGAIVQATYPQGDTAALLPILTQLDEDVQAVCQLFDANCRPNTQVNLTFLAEPQALLAVPNQPFSLSSNITLPSPILVGYPIDQTGERILAQAYGQWVVGNVLRHTIADFWGETSSFYNMVVAERLAKLEVMPRPTADLPLPPADLVYGQDIAARCVQDDGLNLVQYRPPLATQTQLQGTFITNILPAPDGRAIALSQQSPNQSGLNLWLPHSGTTFPLALFRGNYTVQLAWRPHPAGPRLLLFNRSESELETNITRITLGETCNPATCPIIKESQTEDVYWSPDGQQTLVLPTDGRVWLGNSYGVPQVEGVEGRRPFWLDNEQYSVIQYRNQFSQPDLLLRVRVAAPQEPQLWLTSDDLRAAVPEGERPANLGLISAEPWGTDGRHFLVLGWVLQQTETVSPLYFFHYDGQTAALRHLLTAPSSGEVVLSPTGTQLASYRVGDGGEEVEIYMYDRETDELESFWLASSRPLVNLAWSADGRWLLATAGGQVHLINPQAPAVLYRTPLTGCMQAVWVQGE